MPETTETRLPPMTPAKCDLRGMQFMPLFGDVLLSSTTWIGSSDEGRVAALRLWWHSYAHEIPAASLPNDDKLLAVHAGYGNAHAKSGWARIKVEAMRGWVLCADGRWYHPFVANIAIDSWKRRKQDREKQRRFRAKIRALRSGDKTGKKPLRNGDGHGDATTDSDSDSDSEKKSLSLRKKTLEEKEEERLSR